MVQGRQHDAAVASNVKKFSPADNQKRNLSKDAQNLHIMLEWGNTVQTKMLQKLDPNCMTCEKMTPF
jgi:hypothetical protein